MDIREIKNEMENNWPFTEKPNDTFFKIYKTVAPAIIRKKIGEVLFTHYFKFGFVRNPWDRVVSLYLRKEGIQMANRMTFEQFVFWIQNCTDTCIHPSRKRNQLDFFTNQDGKVLVDFIGKFENIDKDWEIICNKLGLLTLLPHKKKNNDRIKHYMEYYTDLTRAIIQEKFIVDINYFSS